MAKLDYLWTDTPSSQYVDGHERPDIVAYRQNVFLPAWLAREHLLHVWTRENEDQPATTLDKSVGTPIASDSEVMDNLATSSNCKRNIVVWAHDETVFYANNRRKRRWVHKTETAVPKPKGEGALLMVADFVSADYGWLQSPNGKESARVTIRPGAQRDGYFTNRNVLVQVTVAMDIIQKHFLSGTWYFSNFFFIIFHHFSMMFYPFPLFSLSFTPQEKTIRVLLIPRRSRAQRTTTTDDPFPALSKEA